MVHDRVRIRLPHAGQLFVAVEKGFEAQLSLKTFKRQTPLLAELFGGSHAFAVELIDLGELSFIEHRHFGFATPAP